MRMFYYAKESKNETCCLENGPDRLADQYQAKLIPESKLILLTAV